MDEEKEASSEDVPDLLFFDTFAHENSEQTNLDFVQFASPIYIHQIQVIPLGSKIEADLPGRVRLGATNPSSFSLQFFISDLTKPNLSTFAEFGSLDYKQNVVNEYLPVDKKPTTGLLIKGCYRTLTLAIFGEATDFSAIDAQSDTPCTTPVPESSSIGLEDLSATIVNPELAEAASKPVEESSGDLPEAKSILEDDKLVSSTISQPDELPEEAVCSSKPAESAEVVPEVKVAKPSQVEKLRDARSHRHSPVLHSSSSKSPSYSERRRRSRSRSPPSRAKRTHHSSRSPYLPRGSKSPNDRVRSPSRRRSRSPKRPRSRSPRAARSRSPRSLRSLSRSPRYTYRHASPASKSPRSPPSPRSLRSLRSASSRSHSPLRSPRSLDHREKHELPPKGSEKSAEDKNSVQAKVSLPVDSDLLEPISPEHSSTVVENVSEEEFPDVTNGDTAKEHEEFEAISSEEEYIDEPGMEDTEILVDYSDYQLHDYSYIWTFNPFHCQFSALKYFPDASATVCEKQTRLNRGAVDENKRNELIAVIKEFADDVPKHEKWIEAVEKVANEIVHLSFSNNELVSSLLSWALVGLDYEQAIKQPQLGYKVRHLKAGIKLLMALLSASEQFLQPLLDAGVLRCLMNLYAEQYMSLPIKLLLVRGLDAVTDFAAGMDHFLTTKDKLGDGVEETCYQTLLRLVMDNKPSRLAYAFVNLLNKVHLFESCTLLNSAIQSCKQNQSADVENVRHIISTITSYFKRAKQNLVQRQRFLPATAQFQINEVGADVYAPIYRWFKHKDVLGCLIHIYKMAELEEITEQCDDLLNEIINEESSAFFLLSKDMIDETNELQSLLVQNFEESEQQPQNVGLRLSFSLQAYSLIDSLFYAQKQAKFDLSRSFDDPEITSTFHRLYTLVFTATGRFAVVDALTSGDNLSVLYPFFRSSGVKKLDVRMSKSVCAAYAVELCLLAVSSCEDRVVPLLQNHGTMLSRLAENSFLPKLSALSSWLTILKTGVKFTYCEQTFKVLVDVLKKYSNTDSDMADNGVFVIPCEVITVLRILKHFCVNPNTNDQESNGENVELKYRYGILQLHSLEGYGAIVSILTKLVDTYLKPSHQSQALVGSQGSLVIFLIKPALEIVKEILQQLTRARGKDFKDVSAVPLFLRIYSLMAIFPSSAAFYTISQSIRARVVDVLTIYTQLCVGAVETEEAFIKSIWAKMIHEIFQYMFSSPVVFQHGLSVLSDMLPLPLPVYSSVPLEQDELVKVVNVRKIWSAHLHALHGEIEMMISSFVYSFSHYLQQMLRRVCVQISDLSAPSALIIVKTVLDLVLDHLSSFDGAISYNFHCVISLLACLSGYPAFKSALIQMVYGAKKEENYGQVLPKLLSLIKISTETTFNATIMELLMGFIHSLCDHRISLNPPDYSITNVQSLSNSIPPKEATNSIVHTLVSVLSVPLIQENVSLVCYCLRTLSLLCEHDFGFWIIKSCSIEKHPKAVYWLFLHINLALETEKLKMEDITQLIESVLYFLKLLLNTGESHQPLHSRHIKCSVAEIKKILKWEKSSNDLDDQESQSVCRSPDEKLADGHPFLTLKNNLLELKAKDDNFYILAKSLEWLSVHIQPQEDCSVIQHGVPVEPLIPSPDSLTTQFANRQVNTVTNMKNEDGHHLNYSSTLPTVFENEQPTLSETQKINLLALAEKYCESDFNIKVALEELCKCQEPGEIPVSGNSETAGNKKQCEPLITPKENIPGMKSPFIAPMRGRGFARTGSMGHSSRVNDPFRSRPPNTSRPPSMHVDDFVALEQGRGEMNNFSTNSMKRTKDYPKRISPPNSRSFASSTAQRSGYYLDTPYNPRRTYAVSPSQAHQSSRANRYSRDSYSPPGRSRSGSTGPPSSSHWSKSGMSTNRRDSRETRDIRLSRQFPR